MVKNPKKKEENLVIALILTLTQTLILNTTIKRHLNTFLNDANPNANRKAMKGPSHKNTTWRFSLMIVVVFM